MGKLRFQRGARALALLAILTLAGCLKPYSAEEFEACMSGVTGFTARVLAGRAGAEEYCDCVLRTLAEDHSRRERAALRAIPSEGGLLAMADSAYVGWLADNTRAHAQCAGS
jgi:hypothetical protein